MEKLLIKNFDSLNIKTDFSSSVGIGILISYQLLRSIKLIGKLLKLKWMNVEIQMSVRKMNWKEKETEIKKFHINFT